MPNQNTRVQATQAALIADDAERRTVAAAIENIRVLNELNSTAALATAVDALATLLDTTVR